MIPVVTPSEMAKIDTEASEPISVLIERAGSAVAWHARHMLQGTYGKRVTIIAGKGNNGADGIEAAKLCCINIIAAVKKGIDGDWDKLDSFVKLTGYVNCKDDFKDQPKIINGASDMLVEIFGDQGRHTRAAVGSNALPLGISVEIDAIVQLK